MIASPGRRNAASAAATSAVSSLLWQMMLNSFIAGAAKSLKYSLLSLLFYRLDLTNTGVDDAFKQRIALLARCQGLNERRLKQKIQREVRRQLDRGKRRRM